MGELLASVSGAGEGKAWEEYSRATFLANTKYVHLLNYGISSM